MIDNGTANMYQFWEILNSFASFLLTWIRFENWFNGFYCSHVQRLSYKRITLNFHAQHRDMADTVWHLLTMEQALKLFQFYIVATTQRTRYYINCIRFCLLHCNSPVACMGVFTMIRVFFRECKATVAVNVKYWVNKFDEHTNRAKKENKMKYSNTTVDEEWGEWGIWRHNIGFNVHTLIRSPRAVLHMRTMQWNM